jgi:L-idonate 5-dehydrogenase
MRFIGSASCYPHIDGGFAQYVSVPETSCHRMPAGVSREVAALMEPLSVATHAVRRAHAAPDSPGKLGGIAGADVLITGGGTIGQLIVMVARAYGARRITLSDPVAFRRQRALESGADSAVDPGDEDADGTLWQEGAEGFEIAFEASGVPEALTTCYRGARRGATVVQVGTQPHGISVATNLVMSKELAVVGSFRFVHVSDAVLSLLQSDLLPLRSIVTSVYGFDETEQAMETALRGEDTLKVQIAH